MKIKTLILCIIVLLSCNENSPHRKHSFSQIDKTEKPTFQIKKGAECFVRVVGITDGDTFKGLTSENQEIKCRLFGIDAPEKKQAFGQKSKQHLSDLIFEKIVWIKVQGRNFDRAIVWCYTDEGKDVSAEMIRSGQAWHFKKYSNDSEYAKLETHAQNAKIGLWEDKDAVPPWDWRRDRGKSRKD